MKKRQKNVSNHLKTGRSTTKRGPFCFFFMWCVITQRPGVGQQVNDCSDVVDKDKEEQKGGRSTIGTKAEIARPLQK